MAAFPQDTLQMNPPTDLERAAAVLGINFLPPAASNATAGQPVEVELPAAVETPGQPVGVELPDAPNETPGQSVAVEPPAAAVETPGQPVGVELPAAPNETPGQSVAGVLRHQGSQQTL